MSKITEKQTKYLISLINKAKGKKYRFISEVQEDGIGKLASKVRGISQVEASALIDKWEAKAANR
jgi:hypothetical protein